jgi:hypothetical protein
VPYFVEARSWTAWWLACDLNRSLFPVGIGEILMRIVAALLRKQMAAKFAKAVGMHKYASGRSGGVEAVFHTVPCTRTISWHHHWHLRSKRWDSRNAMFVPEGLAAS